MRMRLGNRGYLGSFIGGRRIIFVRAAVVGTVVVREAVRMALSVTAVCLTAMVLIAATVIFGTVMVMSAMAVVMRVIGMITRAAPIVGTGFTGVPALLRTAIGHVIGCIAAAVVALNLGIAVKTGACVRITAGSVASVVPWIR
jgi:hypothetical protein